MIHHAIFGFDIPPNPNRPDHLTACLKYAQPNTNLLHGKWSCPNTARFWSLIVDILHSKIGITIDNKPQQLLFHYFPPPSRYPPILHFILLAAMRCLLSNWLLPSIPSTSEVVAQIKHYLIMDKLETIRSKNTHTKQFFKKWRPFIQAIMKLDK